jgi:heme O synthase-like polyprenyltransferase
MLIVAALMLFTFLYKYGVSGRYIIDVAWLFNLSAVLIILFIYSQIKDNEAAKKVFLLTIIFIVLLSCFYNMFGAITGTSNLLKNTNLSRWYILKDIFTFLQ